MPKPIKHILVIRLSAMGDVAMMVPVLRIIFNQYPEVKLTVLTRSFFSPFFRDLPNVSVFSADLKGKHKGLLGLYKLSKELRKLNLDAVADLHNVLRSNIIKLFLFKKRFVQIDKGRAEKKALTTGEIFKQLKTTHQRYMDVFETLGFKIDLSKPTFPAKANLNQKIIQLIGEDTKTVIGIAPFAAFNSKAYSLELMEQVIEELSKAYKVLLFGGGQYEVKALNTIESKYKNVINLAGELSLSDELDVISNLDVMLSMDSGNAHIAAMLGIEVITLWGVTHPYAGFYPFNQKSGNSLMANRERYPNVPTSIYGNKFPEGYQEAINSISPKEVIAKIRAIIIKKRPYQK